MKNCNSQNMPESHSFRHMFTKWIRNAMSVSINKRLISLQNCFGFLHHLARERVKRSFLISGVSMGNRTLCHRQDIAHYPQATSYGLRRPDLHTFMIFHYNWSSYRDRLYSLRYTVRPMKSWYTLRLKTQLSTEHKAWLWTWGINVYDNDKCKFPLLKYLRDNLL
jgi:hypothetical protein